MMLFNCHYCGHILSFPLKFKPQPRLPTRALYPMSHQMVVCQTCKTEYKVDIEVLFPTKMPVEFIEQMGNRPHK